MKSLLFPAVLMTCAALWSAEDDGHVFRAACATAAMGEGLTVVGNGGWLFSRAELRHCSLEQFWGSAAATVSRAPSPDRADPLPAIADFQAQLAKAGIDLLLVPIPPKASLHPAQVPGMPAEVGGTDVVQRRFHAAVEQAGVKVVDLTEAFRAAAKAGEEPFCRTDTHWSPAGVRLAAKLIREAVGTPAWLPSGKPAWTETQENRAIRGDLAESSAAPETLPCWTALPPDGVAAEDRASPIVLLGDSHCLVFHVGQDLHGTGAGLADHLGARFGLPLDVVAVRGADGTTPRQSLQRRSKDPAYLAGKKLVIWCFTARAFSESTSGWPVVPLRR